MSCLNVNEDFEEIIIERLFNVIDLNYPVNIYDIAEEVAQEDIYGNVYYADDGLYDDYIPPRPA